MANILWFRDIGKNDVGTVGGKGANLGEMANADFQIPPGFVLTAQAYFAWLQEAGIKNKIVKMADTIDVENTEQLEKNTEQIRKLVLGTKMSEALKLEIIKAYKKLCEKNIAWLTSTDEEYVAVRSSATAEDLPEASFAGQQETYLNIKGGEDLVDHVKQCWASLFTARATYYRRKQGFPTDKVGIAVVVQKMVNSETAGVMFTADPSTGDLNKIIIEAAFGLGEVVVGGTVTPDHYVVNKETGEIIEKILAEQPFKLSRAARGNKREELNKKDGGKQKLSDAHIMELAEIGKHIEAHYSHPQDIEWATEHEKLYIVQSRAITTLGLKEKMAGAAREITSKNRLLTKGLPASPGIEIGIARIVPGIEEIDKVRKGEILITKMTSPDWVPIMRKSRAIVTDEGGLTCHAAIVSRELGIPCIVGTENALSVIKDGSTITVDGFTGEVFEGKVELQAPKKTEEEQMEIVEEKELDALEEAIEEKEEEGELPLESKKIADEIFGEFGKKKEEEMTKNEVLEEEELLIGFLRKVAAKVKVNVALPEAATDAAKTGADGVGLLRAEHMITESGKHPAEFIREGKKDELVKVIKKGIKAVAEKFKGKPVWYRTFDARTDEFRHLQGGEMEPHEDNPMIGWHGIRRDLDEPELLKAQFEAIKQLRSEGLKNVGIMLPFVQSVEEVRKARQVAKETGLNPDDKDLDFGIMVEVPAAVWIIEELIAENIDFISFGTNDLTQMTLGIDRNNERIQKWFTEQHPAVLRSIEHVINACKKAGVKTSICGQAGSNPEMVKKLVRFGIDSVSANIDAVEKIRHTVLLEEKKLILEKMHKK